MRTVLLCLGLVSTLSAVHAIICHNCVATKFTNVRGSFSGNLKIVYDQSQADASSCTPKKLGDKTWTANNRDCPGRCVSGILKAKVTQGSASADVVAYMRACTSETMPGFKFNETGCCQRIEGPLIPLMQGQMARIKTLNKFLLPDSAQYDYPASSGCTCTSSRCIVPETKRCVSDSAAYVRPAASLVLSLAVLLAITV